MFSWRRREQSLGGQSAQGLATRLGVWLPAAGSNGSSYASAANGHGSPRGSNGHGDPQSPSAGAMIDLRGVSKVYQTAVGPFPALENVGLRVDPGEFVAVVGKSGSGKSTLINMLTGIDHHSAGEVIVAGVPIRELDEGQMAEWRGRTMGIVFQFFQLLPTLTIIENVMLPMDLCRVHDPSERYDRALHLLDQMGIAGAAQQFPTAVSGGDQQRAAIARALANDPPIVVADEPTGNLDSRSASAVCRLFESLVLEGKTILMVTHDDELAAQVPRTITLADGEIVEHVVRAPAALLQPATPIIPNRLGKTDTPLLGNEMRR
jgi:putative ABC transport system ATP-binding protein